MELLNHGVDVVISNFADDLTHRQTLELPVVSRWLSDAGLTVVASGAVDLGILGEELFARATDSELRSMGYWSMVQFSLYAVAIKGEEPPSSFSLRAARRAAHDRLGAEHAPGEVTPPLRPTGEEIAYGESAYAARVSAQLDQYRETAYIHELPPAFHYWSESYLGPRIQRVFGATQAHEIIAAAWASDPPSKEGSYSFASLGAGDCSIEIAVARQLIARGLQNFRIDAFELSAGLQERAREAARQYEVEERFRFIECDLNNHDIVEHYDGVMAHHSLHHFVKLERIFDNVKQVLRPEANFVVWDMIGRNGHMRWPETLSLIEHLWPILPEAKKFNHMLHETWPKFVNFDCSQEGFEGVRAQDILPLLLERFYPSHFVAAGGIIEVFIDRSFGPNFNPSDDWDRQFIDLVEHLNSRLIECGAIKPTMMYAVFRNECCECRCEGDLTPKFCVRAPI